MCNYGTTSTRGRDHRQSDVSHAVPRETLRWSYVFPSDRVEIEASGSCRNRQQGTADIAQSLAESQLYWPRLDSKSHRLSAVDRSVLIDGEWFDDGRHSTPQINWILYGSCNSAKSSWIPTFVAGPGVASRSGKSNPIQLLPLLNWSGNSMNHLILQPHYSTLFQHP